LKNSIRAEKKGEFTWEVATNIGYGLFVEFGTYKQKAQPFLRPAFKRAKRKVFKELRQAFAKR
jgi:HK97 gp10 family phage protein